ncbi:MAG: Hsp33 family molecular chaperone [Hyphomicrobiaceae bacterium]|nr:Hsp33 family molecular chaperone [Hyphomicrobiaceae bacterium]
MAERRMPAAAGGISLADDLIMPFRTERSGVFGRVVRLGPVVDGILRRHDYPEPVSRVIGEAVALTALLGSSLKFDSAFDGRLILQTKTDGAIGMLVVDFEEPGRVRAYASFDKARVEALGRDARDAPGRLLGAGHLAMTIDPGGSLDRYQGIVALDGGSLSDAAHAYFRQSEQIPTFIRLAVARHYAAGSWQWRAGGLLVQYVPPVGEGAAPDENEHALVGEDDERWTGARMLAATVEDHELLDPMLTPDRLLYRLFAEEGVRAFPVVGLTEHCRCSRDRVGDLLETFGASELADMREPDGAITVTCEFCNAKYRFESQEIT